jgi:TM2 domain-containing membrane protein YozV
MFCSNCGKEIDNNAKFCGNCGKPTAVASFCPACGAQSNPLAEVCSRCGTRLISQVAPTHNAPPVAQYTPPAQPQYVPPAPAPPPAQQYNPPPPQYSAPQPQYTPPPQYAAPQPQYSPPPQYAQPVAPPPQCTPPPVNQTIVQVAAPQAPASGNRAFGQASPKSKMVAAILCFFFGTIGIHLFYVGKIGGGILRIALGAIGYIMMIAGIVAGVASSKAAAGGVAVMVIGYVVLAVVGIWTLVDFIKILIGKFTDSNGYWLT